jgi:hypothetical protein
MVELVQRIAVGGLLSFGKKPAKMLVGMKIKT